MIVPDLDSSAEKVVNILRSVPARTFFANLAADTSSRVRRNGLT